MRSLRPRAPRRFPPAAAGRSPARPRKRVQASTLANPVLIGAVTVLALLVAVFLAYNANMGLPFVPTKQLKVDIDNGSNLVVGNDVSEGGFRIGSVAALKPIELPSGRVVAQLTLALNEAHGDVPVDSTVAIRPRSLLGLKYVDLEKGTSRQKIADGGTLPISRTKVPVQLDDVFNTFDPRTRTSIQGNLAGIGDTVTGRGAELNDTIHSLPELLTHLQPVAHYLADPSTQLTWFLTTLDRFVRVVAPVADVGAHLFTTMASTFEAVSRDPAALTTSIARSPSTLDVATASLRAQQPFLVDFATLGQNLTPATAELRAALPDINPAIEVGTRTLRRTPVLNDNLQQVMGALKRLALAPGTDLGLNALTSTVGIVNPIVRYLGPFQTVCDDWNYWWTYLAEHLSEKTQFGFAQRALLKLTNVLQPNNIAQQGATAPANGGSIDTPLGGNEFLHAQNYGAAINAQGAADCETGQRGYPKQLNHFDPQHRALGLDQHTPGDQGPTFAGRARVPVGETFSRDPQTGPQTVYNPSNP
ncbi:MAG: MlaD family protein [Solirubrobacteraceae bacterium]